MSEPAQATVEQYRDASLALLPPGSAFSKSIYGGLAELLEALSVEPAREQEVADRMLVNYDPAYADEMLVEWEKALGLSGAGTLTERQAALITKLRGRTSHAKKLFEDAALALGYGEETWVQLDLPIAKAQVVRAPRQMVGGRWRFSFESPVASSTLGSSGVAWLTCFGDLGVQSGIYLNGFGGNVHLSIVPATNVNAWGPTIVFAARQRVTVDVDVDNGKASVSGAASGNGTFSVAVDSLYRFTDGTMRIGYGPSGVGDSPFTGYVGDFAYYSRTGIEFVTFPASVAGEMVAGEPLYGDDLANVVRMYVPVDDQTADDVLREQFDYLRRQHGYFEIRLEGPMGAERKPYKYRDRMVLSADDVVANLTGLPIRYQGYVSIQVFIDNGAGIAPTDSPVGVWELYVSTDGIKYTRLTNSLVDTELAKIAATGNNLIDTFAMFTGVPGTWLKLRYNQTSGGATSARADVYIATW